MASKNCKYCNEILTSSNWYPSHKLQSQYKCKECNTKLQRKYYIKGRLSKKISRLKLKKEIIDNYGGKCICCQRDHWLFLTIDHINGGGNIHRKSLGFNSGGGNFYQWLKNNNFPQLDYQLLCHNCNLTKGHQGFCPCNIKSQSNNCVFCNVALNDNWAPFNKLGNNKICNDCLVIKSRTNNPFNKKYILNQRLKIINNYGKVCSICNESEPYHLVIDHINNDGSCHRKIVNHIYRYLIKLGYPKDNYQLLCHNCNSIKNNTNIYFDELVKRGFINISIEDYINIIRTK